METKEQIKQRIQEERGKYERQRRKEFEHFKNIGRLDLYYKKKIPLMPKIKIENIVSNLNWWQRIHIVLVLGFKKIWRKLFH
jgi:hypothetical protein